jgi:hypothetical protein
MRNGFNGYERLIERVTRPLRFGTPALLVQH